MAKRPTVFDLFGGIRPMARALQEKPSNVMSWKRSGRIPAEKQRLVLTVAADLKIDVSADDVVFPMGRPVDPIAPAATAPLVTPDWPIVRCDREDVPQRRARA